MLIGSSRSKSVPKASVRMLPSAARRRLRLPMTVLISPLWASARKGWASGQAGKVFVENREWTIASSEVTRGSRRSG